MNIGIALGTSAPAKVKETLHFALEQLSDGHSIELFILLDGVRIFELAKNDRELSELMGEVFAKGASLAACRSCALVHGLLSHMKCRMASIFSPIALWWRSDRYYFVHKFSSIG